jgi:XTP/dITP diphosphohydrolase
LAEPEGNFKITRGECFGLIGMSPKGHTGFGYDPLFVIPKFDKTVAELGPRVKDKISHRSQAIQQARRIIMRHVQAE